MFVEVHTPDHLSGSDLDTYLERGWFRMGQTIFTTNFAHVKDDLLSTIWLRADLEAYEQDRTHTQLIKRNGAFVSAIRPAEITPEKENLFARYRASLTFPVAESLRHLLFGNETVTDRSIYNTWEVTLRDGDKLIACGFFDLGAASAQGIVSFYDPQYKKFSLGKYVIYSKIQYCKNLGLKYFYPGYFVPGNPNFDYKLMVAREVLQFLCLHTHSWRSVSDFTEADVPVRSMRMNLIVLKTLLEEAGIESRVMNYEFFDAGLIPQMQRTGLFDFPVFLHLGGNTDEPVNLVVVFDVRDRAFHLLLCQPVWKPDRINPDTGFYSAYFLKPVQEIYSSPDARAIAGLLARINRQAALQQR